MIKYISLIIISFLFLISCKKNKNELVADFKANYRKINVGEKIKFTDKSRNNPDTWNWIFNGGQPMISEIQNPEVVYTTSGIYSVTLTVRNAKDNNSLTKSDYIEVVDFACGNDIIDNRDGKVYQTIAINNHCWLKQNLNVGLFSQSNNLPSDNNLIEKLCFNNDESNCLIYGALYPWNEMMKYYSNTVTGICPSGFLLSSKQLFDELIIYGGGNSYAGGKLKQTGTTLWSSPNAGATDEYNFTALPSGYIENNVFLRINRNTIFWTSDDTDADNANAIFLSTDNAKATDTILNKKFAAPVRCVRNL